MGAKNTITIKQRPSAILPTQQPVRDKDAFWQHGEQHRTGHELIPHLTRHGMIWPAADPAVHGRPAARSGRPSWEEERY